MEPMPVIWGRWLAEPEGVICLARHGGSQNVQCRTASDLLLLPLHHNRGNKPAEEHPCERAKAKARQRVAIRRPHAKAEQGSDGQPREQEVTKASVHCYSPSGISLRCMTLMRAPLAYGSYLAESTA